MEKSHNTRKRPLFSCGFNDREMYCKCQQRTTGTSNILPKANSLFQLKVNSKMKPSTNRPLREPLSFYLMRLKLHEFIHEQWTASRERQYETLKTWNPKESKNIGCTFALPCIKVNKFKSRIGNGVESGNLKHVCFAISRNKVEQDNSLTQCLKYDQDNENVDLMPRDQMATVRQFESSNSDIPDIAPDIKSVKATERGLKNDYLPILDKYYIQKDYLNEKISNLVQFSKLDWHEESTMCQTNKIDTDEGQKTDMNRSADCCTNNMLENVNNVEDQPLLDQEHKMIVHDEHTVSDLWTHGPLKRESSSFVKMNDNMGKSVLEKNDCSEHMYEHFPHDTANEITISSRKLNLCEEANATCNSHYSELKFDNSDSFEHRQGNYNARGKSWKQPYCTTDSTCTVISKARSEKEYNQTDKNRISSSGTNTSTGIARNSSHSSYLKNIVNPSACSRDDPESAKSLCTNLRSVCEDSINRGIGYKHYIQRGSGLSKKIDAHFSDESLALRSRHASFNRSTSEESNHLCNSFFRTGIDEETNITGNHSPNKMDELRGKEKGGKVRYKYCREQAKIMDKPYELVHDNPSAGANSKSTIMTQTLRDTGTNTYTHYRDPLRKNIDPNKIDKTRDLTKSSFLGYKQNDVIDSISDKSACCCKERTGSDNVFQGKSHVVSNDNHPLPTSTAEYDFTSCRIARYPVSKCPDSKCIEFTSGIPRSTDYSDRQCRYPENQCCKDSRGSHCIEYNLKTCRRLHGLARNVSECYHKPSAPHFIKTNRRLAASASRNVTSSFSKYSDEGAPNRRPSTAIANSRDICDRATVRNNHMNKPSEISFHAPHRNMIEYSCNNQYAYHDICGKPYDYDSESSERNLHGRNCENVYVRNTDISTMEDVQQTDSHLNLTERIMKHQLRVLAYINTILTSSFSKTDDVCPYTKDNIHVPKSQTRATDPCPPSPSPSPFTTASVLSSTRLNRCEGTKQLSPCLHSKTVSKCVSGNYNPTTFKCIPDQTPVLFEKEKQFYERLCPPKISHGTDHKPKDMFEVGIQTLVPSLMDSGVLKSVVNDDKNEKICKSSNIMSVVAWKNDTSKSKPDFYVKESPLEYTNASSSTNNKDKLNKSEQLLEFELQTTTAPLNSIQIQSISSERIGKTKINKKCQAGRSHIDSIIKAGNYDIQSSSSWQNNRKLHLKKRYSKEKDFSERCNKYYTSAINSYNSGIIEICADPTTENPSSKGIHTKESSSIENEKTEMSKSTYSTEDNHRGTLNHEPNESSLNSTLSTEIISGNTQHTETTNINTCARNGLVNPNSILLSSDSQFRPIASRKKNEQPTKQDASPGRTNRQRAPAIHIRYRSGKKSISNSTYKKQNCVKQSNQMKLSLGKEVEEKLGQVIKQSLELQREIMQLQQQQRSCFIKEQRVNESNDSTTISQYSCEEMKPNSEDDRNENACP